MSNITYQCRTATDREREFTAERLRAHTEAAVGVPVSHEPFGMLAYDGAKLIGSVVGKIYSGWLHIDLIWVDDAVRKKGIGRNLMQDTVEAATHANLNGIEVWTQSWQAPEFYRRIGFEEFAVLDDFTPGHKRHAFRKYLKAA